MNDIIKIYQQTNDVIYDKIIVFFGNLYGDKTNELFATDPSNDIFKDVFSEHEFKMITEQKIKVVFTKQRIYLDDTIDTIKKKIISEYPNDLAYENIYIYTKQITDLNNINIYESLSQKGKIAITRDILLQFISNIKDFNVESVVDKEIYDYNDIIGLNLTSKKQIIDVPLGQYFITSDSLYSYTVNPYKVIQFSKILTTHASSIITTSNKNLLLSYGFIFENTIYLNNASDVLDYAISKNISEKTMVQVYYPFLNEKKIFDKELLDSNIISLINNNKTLLNTTYIKQNDNINLFYNIYESRKHELTYIHQGIRNIEFTMSQDYEYNIPLDTIFKLIHTSKTNPLIKYNPSNRLDSIYKLYCDKNSKNGKKIPYLSKTTIFKLAKIINASKRVTCYIEHTYTDEIIPVYIGFDPNANIFVSINFKNPKTIIEIENIITETINPVIQIIHNYLNTNGYKMNLFSNLYDNHVEITDITYNAYITIEKQIDMNKLVGCVSSVFNIVIGELAKGIVMRYKRVANYNEMDSIEAFIVELLNRANEGVNIVKAVMNNFQMNETNAQLKIADVLNNLQVIQHLGKTRKLKIKNNPGFLTKITQDQFTPNIMIDIENITSIFYMNMIPIYIDSIIRITQQPESSEIDISTINALCNIKQKDDIKSIDDIIANSEKPLSENIPVAIIAQDLTFGEGANTVEHKSINVLDFLFDDDDDDDDDADDDNGMIGGINSESEDEEGIDIELDDDEDINVDDIDIDADIDADIDIDIDADVDKDIDKDIDVDKDIDKDIDIDVDADIDIDADKGMDVAKDKDTEVEVKPKKIKKIKKILKIKDNFDSDEDDDKIDTEITNMSISDPNPFFKKLREKDPTLFLTESDGKFKAYSRTCPWNKRKQPVILTDEEKDKIDKEHPGSYDKAIKYGSNPDKKYWYICPRYWDLKRNTSLTKEEVDSGKYGKVIPQKVNGKPVKTVPKGTNIWEFTDAEGSAPIYHVGKDGEYVQHNPGFLNSDVHPKGLCVPCCFSKWDGKQQERRSECNQDTDKDKGRDKPLKTTNLELNEYIKGPEKFPLQEGRFGYLPMQIQRFLMVDNKVCQISDTITNLKKNESCYLRKGVENSKSLSFIGCIADVYYDSSKTKEYVSINKFIQDKILPMLTLDNFVKYQNGNLITDFQSKDTTNVVIDEADISDTKIYKIMYDNNKLQLKKIVSAYNNFKLFLQSPTSTIDYKYIWDLICDKNESLFPDGVNLIILEMPLDDITSNVNIICPSNFYSNNKFDENKGTIIIMKKYEYFEPIYIVTNKSTSRSTLFDIVKIYPPVLFNKIPNLRLLRENIMNIYSSMCKPLPSILNTAKKYNIKTIKFTQNHTLEKIIDILKEHEIDIVNTVVNYDNKVIGLIVLNNDKTGFIPCFPSGIQSDLDIILMDDIREYLMTFEETVDFLQTISKDTNKQILCEPVVKIVEDGLIVGLLTQTNQFIELKEPEQDTDILLKYTIIDENYNTVNKNIINTYEYDETRIEYIKKIKLETALFNEFRNKLKMLLSKYENNTIREEIESISNSKYLIYHVQLEKLISLIKSLMKDKVEFVNISKVNLSVIEDALDKHEVILIPQKNLMSNIDNETIYYSKLSDELIRYNRIKQFMFEPKIFLNFNDLKYDLHKDEIILLQSLLTSEYFDDLVPMNEDKYISFNNYDTVQPNITHKYDNEYEVGSTISKVNGKTILSSDKYRLKSTSKNIIKLIDIGCPTTIKSISPQLKLKFPNGFKEIEFSKTNYICSFDVMLTIVNNYTLQDVSVRLLKNDLIEMYEELNKNNNIIFLNIFYRYGSVGQYRALQKETLSISDMILDNDYNMNNIDIVLLSKKYDIPITLISPTKFKENDNGYMSINVKKSTYIITTPTFDRYRVKPAKYKMVLKDGYSLIDIEIIKNETTRNNILSSVVDVDDVINKFTTTVE